MARNTRSNSSRVYLCGTPQARTLSLRWSLVRGLEDSFRPAAFFCSNTRASAEQIIVWFYLRRNIEITFEELRACLGFDTQCQWSGRAVERTTRCLFGLFSLVVLMTRILYPENLTMRQTSWYQKESAPLSDALAAVRHHVWSSSNDCRLPQNPDLFLIPQATLFSLLDLACYSH